PGVPLRQPGLRGTGRGRAGAAGVRPAHPTGDHGHRRTGPPRARRRPRLPPAAHRRRHAARLRRRRAGEPAEPAPHRARRRAEHGRRPAARAVAARAGRHRDGRRGRRRRGGTGTARPARVRARRGGAGPRRGFDRDRVLTAMAARVFLLGGTSYTGKSTTARALADRLGWDCVSTDRLGRHPGRPWADDGPVPDHVLRHYRTLPVDELTAGQLRHYERLWPAVADLVTARIHAASRYAEAGDDQRAVVDSFVGRTLG